VTNIIRGFLLIWQFDGRDTRAQFWPFWFAILALNLVYIVFVYMHAIGQVYAQCSYPSPYSSHVDICLQATGIGRAATNMAIFGGMVTLILMAAATIRRLHDVGKSADILILQLCLMLVPTITYCFITPVELAAHDLGWWIKQILDVIGIGSLLLQLFLLVTLSRPSSRTDNEYGLSSNPVTSEYLRKQWQRS
jgi:uncharacterized membrane protein YhaH (DUF805 family)